MLNNSNMKRYSVVIWFKFVNIDKIIGICVYYLSIIIYLCLKIYKIYSYK